MKIRADFVTNSSSSSYVDIYADNPVLQELIKKYDEPSMDIYGSSTYAVSEHYTSDFCNEDEKLEYPVNLLDYLNMVTQSKSKEFQEEVKSREQEILGKFLYAKYNTGFSYTDGALSGEEDHITVSSRWGVIHEQSKIFDDEDEYIDEDDEDEDGYDYDPDWTFPEIKKVVRPSEATAGFEGARPEDLMNKPDLGDALKYVLDHLSAEDIIIENRTFGFMGLYKQYWKIVSESKETENDEDGDDEWEEDEDPWSDRESCYSIDENWPETKLIKWWMPQGSEVKAIDKVEISKIDYLVVRLDAWAVKCINVDKVKEAVEQGVPVISEYQFWKAIFSRQRDENKDDENPENKDFIIENGVLKEYKGQDRIVEVPVGVESIEDAVFSYNKTMTNIKLPEGLRTIGENAFMGAALEEIVLPESLEEIGEGVFCLCEGFDSIRIPRSVKAIGSSAFNDCALSEITVDEDNSFFTSVDGVLFSKDMSRLIAYPKAKGESRYVVPEEVREIGDCAFWQNNDLEEVVFPAGLESIGGTAFCLCRKLQKADLPDGIINIDSEAFSDTNIGSVNIPGSLSVIADGVFMNNDSLQEVSLSEGVTTISDNAFAGTEIRELIIPESVTEISETAFSYCYSLEHVTVPSHIKNPEKYFEGCTITINE